ncbi:MAG: hypothetical protein ABR878_04230 [Roseiarcus sp.]|jgi:hypothetical protein
MTVPRITEQARFDDLLVRIDHHAHILRSISTDFFKTMALTNAGGIISILTLIVTFFSNGQPLPSVIAGNRALAKFAILCLTVGLIASIAGYPVTYIRAHSAVIHFRNRLDEALFNNVAVAPESVDISMEWTVIYTMICLVTVVCFLIALGIGLYLAELII